MRLIDADKIDEVVKPWSEEMDYNCVTITDARKLVLNAINRMATVDAAQVVHAHWVRCKGDSGLWYCSRCKINVRYNPNPKTYQYTRQKRSISDYHKFCRYCGSRMDEKDGGQEKEVKCKDCKNGIAESSCIWCYKHHMPCGENHHCSDGKRKDGEQDDQV